MIKNFIHILTRVNHVLSVIVIVFGAYILLIPVIPEIGFAISYAKSGGNKTIDVPAIEKFKRLDIDSEGGVASASTDLVADDLNNKLVIPKIFIDGNIYEGDKEALLKGIWRRPNSSTPDAGGNTVIVAHRFLYTSGPNTFYHLDKLEVGDKFSILWKNKVYNYEVFDVSIVDPSQIEIEENTINPIITLYTCTPLYTAEKRLVVKANLV